MRLVLGTNVAVEAAVADGRLAHDLLARLHRVGIPPLRERRADVPAIFLEVLRRTLDPDTSPSSRSTSTQVWPSGCACTITAKGNVRALVTSPR